MSTVWSQYRTHFGLFDQERLLSHIVGLVYFPDRSISRQRFTFRFKSSHMAQICTGIS